MRRAGAPSRRSIETSWTPTAVLILLVWLVLLILTVLVAE